MRRPFAFASLALLIFLSCRASTGLGGWLVYPSGSVLFQDEFSDPASGWDRAPNLPDGSLDYMEGVYHIRVSASRRLLWTGPPMGFRDVRIEVDAISVNGEGDDDFGVVCRAVDRENFYFLAISSDGYYGIGKVKNGEDMLIGMAEMPPSELILKGVSLNHLRADCIADRLELSVNGQLLASARDSDFPRGQVGLLAGTLGAESVEVLFDNFSVLAP